MEGRRWAAWVIAVCSCGGGDSPGEPSPPVARGIRIVAGTNISDSAGAVLAQKLRVEVTDSAGRIAPAGTIVRFTAVRTNTPAMPVEAWVQSLTSPTFEEFAAESTDASGQVAVAVKLGHTAGAARIAIAVPVLRLADTARFTILPGAAVGVSILPADTAVYVGRSYLLRGGVTDTHGNPRNEPVTWSVSLPGVSITANGVVTGSEIGRYTITATAGRGIARGGLSVIPAGRIAAWRVTELPQTVVAVDLDGSNLRVLANTEQNALGVQPSWVPQGNSVIFNDYNSNAATEWLRIVDDSSGSSRLFFTPQPPNVSAQAEPIATADGQWVYFSAFDTRCRFQYYCIHRSRVDGTGVEILDQFIQLAASSFHPGPSPDGSKVAFVTFVPDGLRRVRVLDVVNRRVAPWLVSGTQPRWSPSGRDIAYVQDGGGAVMLVADDGTNERRLSEFGFTFVPEPISWSRDGRWIIARTAAGLNVIDATRGTVMPIRYLSGLYAPSWK